MTKKKTKEEFIQEAQAIHGDTYDYSKVVYVNCKSQVIITCKIHGEFPQAPLKHLSGQGCSLCGIIKRAVKRTKTKEKFIQEAQEIHGDTYDYSKVEYVNTDIPVTITCKIHGDFPQTPSSHLLGCGCNLCGIARTSLNQTKTKEKFFQEAQMVHGNTYDYSKVEYVNTNTPVTITCKIHGEFLQRPSSHLLGCGCNLCGIIKRSIKKTKIKEKFIKEAQNIHGDTYDYSKVEYVNTNIPVTITCKTHGEFLQKPSSHLLGCGCNLCGIIKRSIKKTKTKEDFIKEAQKIHGNTYDYSKVKYVNAHSKITIICKIHGGFLQTADCHLVGSGCNLCGIIKTALKRRNTTEGFIKKAQEIHGDIYDYSKVDYVNNNTPITIICKIHGGFLQKPSKHLCNHGCTKCYKNHSKSQIEWLNYMQIIQGCVIQHALNGAEYNIPGTRYKADGFCIETNTVYEFHGDYWHGNPEIFPAEEFNKTVNKSFGKLYEETIKKENKIRELGFNLIAVWENDWTNKNKLLQEIKNSFVF